MPRHSAKSLQEIKDIVTRHREVLEQEYKVKQIGVFGSFVRGEQGGRSDIDILVEFMELQEYLRRRLGRKVDLVSKGGLKPRIGRRILEEVSYL